MSFSRVRWQRDSNEPAIVMALVRAGATVVKLDTPCDLLVGFRGETYLLEVKRPPGPRGGTHNRKLSASQEKFVSMWNGAPIHVVTSAEQALDVLGVRG